MSPHQSLLGVLLALVACGLHAAAPRGCPDGCEYVLLDDFENVSAWSPGQPQKDLARKD